MMTETKLDEKNLSSVGVDEKNHSTVSNINSQDDFSDSVHFETIPEIPAAKEKALVHKFDWRLMPLFSVVYFLSFLDRANIGNAKIAGMSAQLKLTDNQYSLAVSIFYATYILSEVPAVLIVKKIGPHRFLSALIVGWSLVTIFTAFVRDYWSLVLCRLLLGLLEGGVFPNMSLYILIIYKREEQATRLAYLYVCSCVSGAFGGLIATGITRIKSNGVLEAWSWLYIIEGCISIIAAVWVFFGLPEDPTKAKFLNKEELELMEVREQQRKFYMGSDKFDKKEFFLAIKNPILYMSCIIQFSVDLVLYGYSTFLPSILKLQLGYDSMQAQYLSVPVYALSAISVFGFCKVSDKTNKKYPYLMIVNVFAMVGYIILLVNPKPAVNYFATYLIAIPLYTAVALNITWVNNNMAPHYRRATALGFNQTFGNLAGVIAGQVYRSAPYRLGNGFSLGCVVMAMSMSTCLYLYLRLQNKKRMMILSGDKEDDKPERTGSDDLNFVYKL